MTDNERLIRFAGFSMEEFGEKIFIINDADGSVHALDSFSSAVWRILEEPRTFGECLTMFRTAFPDSDPKKIRAQLRLAIEKMCKKNWIVRLGDSPP